MAKARELAMQIWRAGVDQVRAEQLIAEHVLCEKDRLVICDEALDLNGVERICIAGAGKAAGFLAQELVHSLCSIAERKQLHGMVNVPEDCLQPMDFVQLCAARPAGVNEPRPEGVRGTEKMLDMVRRLRPNDLCICLITGGGSALLPAPKPPVTLDDKLQVTRLLSSRGASIQELNIVRIALSNVKGGGLARECQANRMVTLIMSDIIGDPLELIASGPTLEPQRPSIPPSEVLQKFADRDELNAAVWDAVAAWKRNGLLRAEQVRSLHVLANNQTAVTAAQEYAESIGIETMVLQPESPQTTAEEVGSQIVNHWTKPVASPRCILWGGEPVVHLGAQSGQGGRNQQVALAALSEWERIHPDNRGRLCILSGGTDGEDGPTDAAGALVDAEVLKTVYNLQLESREWLERNDAYPFFDAVGGLIKTGPTHTNVCDLRVSVVT